MSKPVKWKLVPVDPTEEMIEAMREAARKVSRGGISGMTIDAQFRAEHRPEYASYAAMLASAPAPASGGVNAVAVKALEWRSHARGAEADGGRYRIEDNGTNWTDDRYWLFVNVGLLSNHRSKFATLDEAEAAAQADYEQRIHSALSPAATPVSEAEPVAISREMIEAGRKAIADERERVGQQYPDTLAIIAYEAMAPLAKPASSPAGGGVKVTPDMIAAAWAAWHSRHGGKLGPGPGFVEAIKAALALSPPASSSSAEAEALQAEGEAVRQNAIMRKALREIAAPIEGTPIGDPWAFYADLQAVAEAALSSAPAQEDGQS